MLAVHDTVSAVYADSSCRIRWMCSGDECKWSCPKMASQDSPSCKYSAHVLISRCSWAFLDCNYSSALITRLLAISCSQRKFKELYGRDYLRLYCTLHSPCPCTCPCLCREAYRDLVATEGFGALLKGFSMNLVKGPIALSISLTTYDSLRRWIDEDPYLMRAPDSRKSASSLGS